MRSRPVLGYSILFFLSGATALVYELLWVRLLYQSFGSTIQSVTTVVAAYMGGLGLGAWLLGRRADRHPRPAALYGWLEIGIGVFGVASPLILALVHQLWIAAAGSLQLGPIASISMRFGLAALVLFIPTTLMGGTLPVLTRAFTRGDRAALPPELASLYGLNTLGAVLGTALAGFVLIEHVGIRTSLWLTALVNVALGAAAVALARPLPPSPVSEPAPVAPALPGPAQPTPAGAVASPAPDAFRVIGLVLLGATAFAGLLDEIAWTRVLVMVVGGSTYAFTLVLAVFLLGIGAGSAFVARAGRTRAETAAAASAAQGIAAAGAATLLVFFGFLPVYIVRVFQIPGLEAGGRLALMGLAVAVVVLLPAIGMGMTFPLLADLTARRDEARAVDVGRAYALNTVGSIAGAVLTGFVLVVVLGSDRTLRLGVLISAAAALVLAALAARGVAQDSPDHRRLRLRVLGGGALAAAALGAAFGAPRWSTRLVDLGPTIYGRGIADAAKLEAFLAHRGTRQLAFREGRNATVSVWESDASRSLKINGKADASDHGDMDTQVMLGLAPLAARSRAASALVIGYGSGVTARVLAEAPGMRAVRVVELEPAVLAMDSLFRHVNGGVLDRAGVTVATDDARSALQLEHRRYDVVVSEPSNPWVAGVATLYTPEFFRIVRTRLAPDGVFCQWIQLYQLPLPVVASIVRNLRDVFPHVEVWFGSPHDLLVLGSSQPFAYDRAWLARLLGSGAPLEGLGRDWLGLDAADDYFGRFLLGPRGVEALVARATVAHSDDHPRLEFVAARRFLDGRGTAGILDSLILLRPPEDVRNRVDALLLAKALGTRPADPAANPYVEAAFRSRPNDAALALRAALGRLGLGDTAAAEAALEVARRGRDPHAMLLTGLVAANKGEVPRARSMLHAALAAGADPGQAHAALAALASRARRWAEAATEVRAALAGGSGTFRQPFPRELVAEVLTQFALEGPADEAADLVDGALRVRPGWARLHEIGAVAVLRRGRCDEAVRRFSALLEFGITRPDGPDLVRRCLQGRLE